MKRIVILGATGSIGRQAAEVIAAHPDDFQAVALAARVSAAACTELARSLGAKAYCGETAALAAVAENEADICLVATVGLSALRPTLLAIERGMDIALATKEVLVMAGGLVTRLAAAKGVKIIPVDSEHSAIYQCLGAGAVPHDEIDTLTLTCSGGPFLDAPADLGSVTPAMALRHPRWRMGPKVTVDSATLVNKALEVAEAHWLFALPGERIGTVVHPEAVVHSLVTFRDGATLAQLSPPDMRVAIQYAFSAPMRLAAERERLDLGRLGALTFRPIDERRFPAVRLMREALETQGAAATFAAADELAVARFVRGEIRFDEIVPMIERSLEHVPAITPDSPEAVEALVREVAAAAGR